MKDRISKLIALGAASEVQMDELGFEGVVAAKSEGPQVLTYAVEHVSEVERGVSRFLLSTETPDRRGDIVRQAGLDFTNYRKNNVALINHDDTPEGVAGTAVMIRDGTKTWMDLKWTSANPRAAMVRAMVDEGTIKASSISILPKKVDPVREKERREEMGLGRFGVVHERSEVLEGSVVTLPMQAEAVRNALRAGVEKGLWTPDAAEDFDRWGLPTERDLMKRCGLVTHEGATTTSTSNGIEIEHVVYSNALNFGIEPAWLARFEKSLDAVAARIERAVATLNVKQAAAGGVNGARVDPAAESDAPGSARGKQLTSLLLHGLEARERKGI